MRKICTVLLAVILACGCAFSCSKTINNGPLCAQGVQPTFTSTPTPDMPYTVYLHQEATPMAGAVVTLKRSGATLSGVTDSSGKYVFNVHSGGQWELTVGDYDGFEGQKFTVEPLANTYNAINYGIPSLEVQLVSGSESIPMAASTIVYKIIYHTIFPRPVNLYHTPLADISPNIPKTNFRLEGDYTTSSMTISKSYEKYIGENSSVLQFYCNSPTSSTTYAQDRILTKNWSLPVTADYIYAVVKAYNDNSGETAYYAGLNNIIIYTGAYVPHGTIVCEVYSAVNNGDAGPGTLISAGYYCFDERVGYGCYSLLAKLDSNHDEDFAFAHPYNNGVLTVRIHDNADGDLDVKRTFSTNNGWSQPCFWWCCTSRDISPQTQTCTDASVPFSKCFYSWDGFRIAFAYRQKSERITSSKQ